MIPNEISLTFSNFLSSFLGDLLHEPFDKITAWINNYARASSKISHDTRHCASYEEETFIFLLLNEVSNFSNKKSINLYIFFWGQRKNITKPCARCLFEHTMTVLRIPLAFLKCINKYFYFKLYLQSKARIEKKKYDTT